MQDLMETDENPQNLNSIESVTEIFSTLNVQQVYQDTSIETELQNVNLSEDDTIKYAKQLISSSISSQQLVGAVTLRRLLCEVTEVPFQKIIQSNVLPLLIQLIPSSDEPLVYEILWIFLNLTEGDKACNEYLLSLNLLDYFNYLLQKSCSLRIFDHIMWAIGNISLTDISYRDFILQKLDLQNISLFLSANANQFSIENFGIIAWGIKCLTFKKTNLDLNKAKAFIPILRKIIINTLDEVILTDALTSHFRVTDGLSNLSLYFDSELLDRLILQLNHPNAQICLFALQNIGNYITETESPDFVECTLLLSKLIECIDCNLEQIRKNPYWVISNIVVDGNVYFSYLLNSNSLEKFRYTLENDKENIINEAIWVFYNLVAVCDAGQSKWIIDSGIPDLVLKKLFINPTICDAIFQIILGLFKFDIPVEIEKIQMCLQILKNAEICIGKNNQKLNKVLDRLVELIIDN